jgi:hypothetical protein
MPTVADRQMQVIGSRSALFAVRSLQIGFIVVAGLVCMSFGFSLIVEVLTFLVVSTVCVIVGHPFAKIEGDDSGLYIQRYMKVRFVAWTDVRGVRASFGDAGIRVDFRFMVDGLRHAVANFPNVSVREAVAAVAGREELEIVAWVRAHMIKAKEPADSRSILGVG